jgi:hypothetical protein
VTVELELPSGRAFDAVGRLVLGGLGARLGLGVDRIADFQLALHAMLRQPRSHTTLVLTLEPTPEDIHVRLGPFDRTTTSTNGVLSVVSPLVDEIATHESGDDLWMDMRVATRRRSPTTG